MESRSENVRPFWDTAAEPEGESDVAPQPSPAPAWTAMARGVALFLGTLLAVDLFAPGGLPEGGPWWLDTRPLPGQAATGFLGLTAAALVLFGVRPAVPKPVRLVLTVCVVLAIALALKNATVYYGLLKRGDLHAGPPVAFPLHVAACFGVVLLASRFRPGPGGFRGSLLALAGFNAALVSFSVAQIACCGPVDARRPAAAAVVFGPRAFEKDGDARLDERVRAAASLHKAGLVSKVLLAGGPAGGRLERVKKIASEGGVPEAAIVALPQGDGRAAVAELARRFPASGGERPVLLAVSDLDHLPRVTVLARQAGVSIFPVPAGAKSKPGGAVLVRETLDLWRSYFRR
jgi:hypothetical protein